MLSQKIVAVPLFVAGVVASSTSLVPFNMHHSPGNMDVMHLLKMIWGT